MTRSTATFRWLATMAIGLTLAVMLPSLAAAQAAGTWTPAGQLATGRSWHTTTVLADGVHVLVAGGLRGADGNSLSSAELFDATTQTWHQVAPMQTARGVDAATLLDDGTVLVVGGRIGDQAQASAERFDPTTETWSPAGRLSIPRSDHTVTLLQDGRVLVAGGLNAGRVLSSAELYDPSTGTWSETGSLATAREDHTATLLPDGRVLVAGGDADDHSTPLASAELFDPATGTWMATADDLHAGRIFHTATLVPTTGGSDKVLIVGGQQHESGSILASAELYDPAADTWRPAAAMAEPREDQAATELADGSVLVSGGQSTVCGGGGAVCTKKTAERYDPQADTWTTLPDMGFYRTYHTLITLPDGRVLVVGGEGISAAAGVGQQGGSLASAEWFTWGGA